MSQSFYGAEPKVVRNKSKFNGMNPEETDASAYKGSSDDLGRDAAALNIMYDKRVFRGNTHNMTLLKQNLTPMQKEELRIKAERERKKVEMIKSQLVEFKRAKNKISPYDLRPGPPARIEVDLSYFLTEQNKPLRPEESEVRTQTDDFLPRPASPPYLPKKTGIDKITQIEDYDLFDYDQEVQPILNVLLSKTVEQALLEVEEESELDSIRRFKEGAYHRQREERQDWEAEVKRELARIKAKNKAVKAARARREQQDRAMRKVQCLALAKHFLARNLAHSLEGLASLHAWRSRFEDQLQGGFKDWLLKKAAEEIGKGARVEEFIGGHAGIIGQQLVSFEKTKEPIKKQIASDIARRENIVRIESTSSRTVHFVFDHGFRPRVSPFSRKYQRFLEGSLGQFEAEEAERFAEYIQNIEAEALEGGNAEWNVLRHNPVVFGESPFFSFDLGSLSRLAFQVADDPFYKSLKSKFYPEVVLVNLQGKVKARVSPAAAPHYTKKGQTVPALKFEDDIREAKLKVNDDRRVNINLSALM